MNSAKCIQTSFTIVGILKYAQPPLMGYHCLEDSYILRKNISGLDQFGCVRQCILSHECTTLMYKPQDGVCLLGVQPCAIAVPHDQLMTMVFRAEEMLECLVPQALSELDSGSRFIKISARRSLARLVHDENIYIGTSQTPNGNNKGYFGFRGANFVHTTNHVLLTVSPQCSMAWLPYTVGHPIPFRAVVCGTWNGEVVYTLRGTNPHGQDKFVMYVYGYPVATWAVTNDAWILTRV